LGRYLFGHVILFSQTEPGFIRPHKQKLVIVCGPRPCLKNGPYPFFYLKKKGFFRLSFTSEKSEKREARKETRQANKEEMKET
jgi:hypothetical protein